MMSIAVQAGGYARRMGRDKALVPLAGKRLIEHVLDRLQGMSDDLFITTNQPHPLSDLPFRLVHDDVPGQGASHGLRTALQAARYDNALIVACDMPFIAPDLVHHLLLQVGQADVIIPRLDGAFEPLLAIYRVRACLPAVERSLEAGNLRMVDFFSDVTVLPIETEVIDRLDPQHLSFFNINTPEDLIRAEKILQGSSAPSPEQPNSIPASLPGNPHNGDT